MIEIGAQLLKLVAATVLSLLAISPVLADGPCGEDFDYFVLFGGPRGFHSPSNAGRLAIALLATDKTSAKKAQQFCAFRGNGSYVLPPNLKRVWLVFNNIRNSEEEEEVITLVAKMKVKYPGEHAPRIELYRGGDDWEPEGEGYSRYGHFDQTDYDDISAVLGSGTTEGEVEKQLKLDFFGTTRPSGYSTWADWLESDRLSQLDESENVRNKITALAFPMRSPESPPSRYADWDTRVVFTVNLSGAESMLLETYGLPTHNPLHSGTYLLRTSD